jgi:hypothetical protein
MDVFCSSFHLETEDLDNGLFFWRPFLRAAEDYYKRKASQESHLTPQLSPFERVQDYLAEVDAWIGNYLLDRTFGDNQWGPPSWMGNLGEALLGEDVEPVYSEFRAILGRTDNERERLEAFVRAHSPLFSGPSDRVVQMFKTHTKPTALTAVKRLLIPALDQVKDDFGRWAEGVFSFSQEIDTAINDAFEEIDTAIDDSFEEIHHDYPQSNPDAEEEREKEKKRLQEIEQKRKEAEVVDQWHQVSLLERRLVSY